MSKQTIVGKRYAKGLFEAANDRGMIEQVEQDLRVMVQSITGDASFMRLWEHPGFPAASKKQLLDQAFGGKLNELVVNTGKLLVDKGREDILAPLQDFYTAIASEALGRASATVYSPEPLSESGKAQVAAAFGKLTGKQISVENKVNRELIGGITVRIGDRLYDGSVAGKLRQLEKSFV